MLIKGQLDFDITMHRSCLLQRVELKSFFSEESLGLLLRPPTEIRKELMGC